MLPGRGVQSNPNAPTGAGGSPHYNNSQALDGLRSKYNNLRSNREVDMQIDDEDQEEMVDPATVDEEQLQKLQEDHEKLICKFV
jgi:hypothetical protein